MGDISGVPMPRAEQKGELPLSALGSDRDGASQSTSEEDEGPGKNPGGSDDDKRSLGLDEPFKEARDQRTELGSPSLCRNLSFAGLLLPPLLLVRLVFVN